MSAVPGLGPGPLRPGLLPHPPRAPADDPSLHPVSSAVEGGGLWSAVYSCDAAPHQKVLQQPFSSLLMSVLAGQHAGVKVRRPHALHACLQTVGPGSSR